MVKIVLRIIFSFYSELRPSSSGFPLHHVFTGGSTQPGGEGSHQAVWGAIQDIHEEDSYVSTTSFIQDQ